MALNDAKEQTRITQEWLAGRSPAAALEELKSLRAGNAQWLMDWDYHMVICDESHRIKNIRRDRTGAVLKLGSKAARRVLMSGTPIQGNPKDAFPQMKFLAPYIIGGDYFAFCKKYVVYAPYDEKVVLGYKNLHVLNRIINSVSSKRELAECVSLPEQTFVVVPYTLSSPQRKAYNKAVQEWSVERTNAADMVIANAATGLSKLLQICSGFVYVQEDTGVCNSCPEVNNCIENSITPGSTRCARKDAIEEIPRQTQWFDANPKLTAVEDLLEDIVPTNKVIIWATFTAELDLLEKSLQKKSIGYVRVDGSTVSQASKYAEEFNTSPACHVYLAHISTGISITLNAAKYAIYFSRNWSLDDRKQSAARHYRMGQTQKTVVMDMCATGTVEVQQLEALNCKQNISELLTKKVDCLLCSQYSVCVQKEIEPWDDGCVYKKTVNRVIAKAAALEED
jgi:SNF2 family DNA or RNA helicase